MILATLHEIPTNGRRQFQVISGCEKFSCSVLELVTVLSRDEAFTLCDCVAESIGELLSDYDYELETMRTDSAIFEAREVDLETREEIFRQLRCLENLMNSPVTARRLLKVFELTPQSHLATVLAVFEADSKLETPKTLKRL